MRIVDLRSDTITLPTPAMRQAMQQAEVGDDVYREDPSVNALEELAAEMTGKPAGLFMVSGTMGNQVALLAHTRRGDAVICEENSHIVVAESGAMAVLSGVQPRTIYAERGILTAANISSVLQPQDVHVAPATLISLENTHNRAGGTCYPLETLQEIYTLALANGIAVHMDGARLFNAALAQKTVVNELCQYADSIQICLSKGLCAPVGSILVGSRDYIETARRYRKMLGGGMRQAGVLAAAGIVALTRMVERLSEDHANARRLAEALAELGCTVDLTSVETNIVIFNITNFGLEPAWFLNELKSRGVKAGMSGSTNIRMVTHYGVCRDDIEYVVNVLSEVLQ